MMKKPPQLTATDNEVLELLAKAREQYEGYLQVARLGEFTAESAPESSDSRMSHDPEAPLSLRACALL